MLQLHGDEGPAYCREAARRTGCKVMKAARVRDAAQRAGAAAPSTPTSTCSTPTRRGRRAAPGRPSTGSSRALHPGTPPVMLSGGLTPDNVADAIAAARPFAVDTASGTEAAPGRKDPAKLTAFFRAVAGGRAARCRGMSAPALERRFGPYGGRYVPETLIPALDELERGVARRARRSRLHRRAGRACCATTSAGRRRSTSAQRLSEAAGGAVWLKREDLHPHRLAQDQQRARPGAARPADGQAARDRRDRRRPARRGDRHRLRAARASSASSTWAPRTCAASSPNVERMRLLGAEVRGGGGRARARSRRRCRAAIRDWVAQRRDHALRDRLGGRARRRTRRSCATCSA